MPSAPLQQSIARRRRRVGLLAAAGLVAASLPLVEAWRNHGLDLRTAVDARRALVASAQAVQTQHALAAHRPYSAAVLAGRTEQEPERLRRQQAVDADVGTLIGLLEAQQLHRALDETDQLRADWTRLLVSVGRRQMSPAASNAAHDLLAEQTFVIVDLIGSDGRLTGLVGRVVGGDAWMLAQRTLPRLAIALAAEAGDDFDPDHGLHGAPALVFHARRATREAAAALSAAYQRSADLREPAPEPALVRALSAVRQHAAALGDTEGATAAARGAARQRALAACIEARAALVARLDATIAAFATDKQLERLLLAAAGLVLLLMGLLAAAMALPSLDAEGAEGVEEGGAVGEGEQIEVTQLDRGIVGQPPPASVNAADATAGRTTASGAGRPESRDAAEALLSRLRRPRRGTTAGVDPAAAADPPADD